MMEKLADVVKWAAGVGLFGFVLDRYLTWRKERLRRKRNERDVFVLKAITAEPGHIIAPTRGGNRYDLATIDQRVYLAQMEEAETTFPGLQLLGRAMLNEIPKWEEKRILKWVKRQANDRLLPDVNDGAREQKMEAVLHEMVDDGKLEFHPPNMWSVK